ncbi:MAG: glycosyltransferase family 1 protein [Candidatus Omnitrophota bacterium]
MKIFFDARMIAHAGIGRYIRGILPEIAKDKSIELCLLGNRILIEKFFDAQNRVIDFNYPIYSIQEQIGFKKLKSTIGDNLLHVPHYNIPVFAPYNLVVTIHDLIHILYPQGASSYFARFYMNFMIRKVLSMAKKVICVSGHTKEAICHNYHVAGTNLEVVGEGVDGSFSKITDEGFLDAIKQKYHLPGKFILYVGSIRKHKNITMLLEVFSKIRKEMPEVSLVLVGKLSQSFDLKLDGVHYLGEVPDDKELAAIYNLSSVFCNLSLFEGFGLTILEAQACGVPIVCSDIAVHRETGGNGILAVPPSNVDQIAQALYNVLTKQTFQDILIKNGLENVQRFSWQKASERVVELYRLVGG